MTSQSTDFIPVRLRDKTEGGTSCKPSVIEDGCSNLYIYVKLRAPTATWFKIINYFIFFSFSFGYYVIPIHDMQHLTE